MTNSTIGTELELLLVDEKGHVKNNAQQILADPRIQTSGCFVHEGTKAQIEVTSDPKPTVHELHHDLRKKLIFLDKVCREYCSSPISVSEFGAGRGKILNVPQTDRLPVYEAVFGKEVVKELLTNSGIHVHISQIPGKELQQYHLLQALDFIFYAFTSTSPINYLGSNGLNCQRINFHRNVVFNKFPLFSQIQDYPSSLTTLAEQDYRRWELFRQKALEQGVTPETYNKIFPLDKTDKTGYHSVRKRDQIGPTGTFEVRSADTCPLNYHSAAAALIKGAHDHAIGDNIPMTIADSKDEYSFSGKQIVLPNLDTIKEYQDRGIEQALRNNFIHSFACSLLSFAEPGLPSEDQKYLSPIKEMLRTRMNPADQIMEFMRTQGYDGRTFSPDQSAQANLFMREQYVNALQS